MIPLGESELDNKEIGNLSILDYSVSELPKKTLSSLTSSESSSQDEDDLNRSFFDITSSGSGEESKDSISSHMESDCEPESVESRSRVESATNDDMPSGSNVKRGTRTQRGHGNVRGRPRGRGNCRGRASRGRGQSIGSLQVTGTALPNIASSIAIVDPLGVHLPDFCPLRNPGPHFLRTLINPSALDLFELL